LRWIRSRYGEVLGRVTAEHEAPVQFQIAPDAISVRIGDILTLAMRPTRLADDTKDWATLLYDPFIRLETSNLGTTTFVRYRDPDRKVQWEREPDAITGYYGTFVSE